MAKESGGSNEAEHILRANTLYEVLGVPQAADRKTVQSAYRILAKKYHSDVAGGSPATIRRINHAWDILKDDEKRRVYDWKQSNTRSASADATRHAAAAAEEQRRKDVERRAAAKAAAEAQARRAAEELKGKETERAKHGAGNTQSSAGQTTNPPKKAGFWDRAKSIFFGETPAEKALREEIEKMKQFDELFQKFEMDLAPFSKYPGVGKERESLDRILDVRSGMQKKLDLLSGSLLEESAHRVTELFDKTRKQAFGKWVEDSFVTLLERMKSGLNFQHSVGVNVARQMNTAAIQKFSDFITLDEKKKYLDRISAECDKRLQDLARESGTGGSRTSGDQSRNDSKSGAEQSTKTDPEVEKRERLQTFEGWYASVRVLGSMNIETRSDIVKVKRLAQELTTVGEDLCTKFNVSAVDRRNHSEAVPNACLGILNQWAHAWLEKLPEQIKYDIENRPLTDAITDPQMVVLYQRYYNPLRERSDFWPKKYGVCPYFKNLDEIWKEACASKADPKIEQRKKANEAFEKWEASVWQIKIIKIETYQQVDQLHHHVASDYDDKRGIVLMYPEEEQGDVRRRMDKMLDDAGAERFKTWFERWYTEVSNGVDGKIRVCDGDRAKIKSVLDGYIADIKLRDFLFSEKTQRTPFIDKVLRRFNVADLNDQMNREKKESPARSPFEDWYRDEWLKKLPGALKRVFDDASTTDEMYQGLLMLKQDLAQKMASIPEGARQQYIDHLDREFQEAVIKKN